jgi:RHS repeat-associated protein
MAGISSKALNGVVENKRGFQSKEIQSKEFTDGSGLDWCDFGARDHDPQIGRWLTVDPKAEKYLSSSPYNFVDNNPVSRVDPTGQDWFYYQAKGEKEKSWHWQKGRKASYTDAEGNKATSKNGYKYLVTYSYDKGSTAGGAPRGTITVYNQNKAVSTGSAFSGAGWWTGGFDQAAKGNYMMNLDSRTEMAKVNNSGNKENTNPPANMGMQRIAEGTVIKYPDGSTHDVNSDYGNYRIRLTPTDGSRDRGLYLHGKNSFWTSRTHGCVCEKDQVVLQYLWEHKEITGKVPFAVGQTVNPPPKEDD